MVVIVINCQLMASCYIYYRTDNHSQLYLKKKKPPKD